jgi:hypothetical protein
MFYVQSLSESMSVSQSTCEYATFIIIFFQGVGSWKEELAKNGDKIRRVRQGLGRSGGGGGMGPRYDYKAENF